MIKAKYLILTTGLALLMAGRTYAGDLYYDAQGRLIQDSDGNIFTYNDNGQILSKRTPYQKYVYNYNGDGVMESAAVFSCNGEVCQNDPSDDITFEISDGKITREIYGDMNNEYAIWHTSDYYYDSNGRVSSIHYNSNETGSYLVTQRDYEYDDKGNVISKSFTKDGDTITTLYRYEYDDNGNITSIQTKRLCDSLYPEEDCVGSAWNWHDQGFHVAASDAPASIVTDVANKLNEGHDNKISIYFK